MKKFIVTPFSEPEEVLSESQIRDIVGAPSIEEENECLCGKQIEDCEDAYEHITSGC